MKARVTLTIDDALLSKAKAAAARRGRSLSAMVEDLLRGLGEEQIAPFGDRWRGAFRLADGDDPRLEALERRHPRPG